jgi:peptidoglycan/LPS O-acetylase OafA/YrhL
MLLLVWHLTLSRNPLLQLLAWSKFTILGGVSYALFILQGPLDKLDTYVLAPRHEMGPVTKFMVFFAVLLCVSFLAVRAEKAVAKRLAGRLSRSSGSGCARS